MSSIEAIRINRFIEVLFPPDEVFTPDLEINGVPTIVRACFASREQLEALSVYSQGEDALTHIAGMRTCIGVVIDADRTIQRVEFLPESVLGAARDDPSGDSWPRKVDRAAVQYIRSQLHPACMHKLYAAKA